jgi:hypothetical protein
MITAMVLQVHESASPPPTARRSFTRHYHLIDSELGNPNAYRDEIFPTRSQACSVAKDRVDWLAALVGLRIVPLAGTGRYLLTTGHRQDAGRIIEVEECGEAECLERKHGSMS